MTKEEIMEKADRPNGAFLGGDYQSHADLDATYARQFLESRGFTVIDNYDTGENGWAITDDHIWLSTNGYIKRKQAANTK